MGKRLLCTRTLFVSDVIDGKPVGVTARIGLKKITEIRNKKRRHDEQSTIPKKRRQANKSFEGITNSLDLFFIPPIQTSIVKGS